MSSKKRKGMPQKKRFSPPVIVLGILVVGVVVLFYLGRSQTPTPVSNAGSGGSNVTLENGVQIVEIKAKGGYTPRMSTAKANIPTIIRFSTAGTFDCSSFVRIPSLNISQSLKNSGNTDISIGSQPAGVLQGSCGMGMYPFQVTFVE